MRKLYKAAFGAALGLVTITAAQAQPATDMFLGMTDPTLGSSANDYVIDLGATSQFTTTASLSWTINSTLFTQAFGLDANALTDVSAGVIGVPDLLHIYQTDAKTPDTTTVGEFNLARGIPAQLNAGASGAAGVYASSAAGSWSTLVAVDPTTAGSSLSGSFTGDTGNNPQEYLSAGILSGLDLYEAIQSGSGHSVVVSPWTLVGTFSVDANSNPSLDANADTITFTGTAVPEPASFGILAGAGLLIMSLRRQFVSKNG